MIGFVYVSGGSGGGLLFLLLFLGLFVVVPLLMTRGAARGGWVVHRGGWHAGPGFGRTYGPGWGRQRGDDGPWRPAPTPVRHGQPQPVDAADVESVVGRLAADVRSLDPGQDAVSRQAMADASERYATATSLLERAGSQDQLRTAWLAAAEGLHATRLVRQRLGLDPGPAPLLAPGQGPQLERLSRVQVEGREHVGSPTYAPGYGHWFPGGPVGDRYVPGGWYAEPFWPGSLVLGALSGFALGSLMGGALSGGLGVPYGYDEGWGGDSGGGGWSGDAGDGGWGGDAGDGGWGGGDFGGGDFGGGGDW